MKQYDGYSIVTSIKTHKKHIFVKENYLTAVFKKLDWIDDECDSVQVCDIADNEGFENLGDLGGFIFYIPMDRMSNELIPYFKGA